MLRIIKPGLLAASLATALATNADQHAEWGYSGAKGPEHWDGVCASGAMQSPIDLGHANAVGEVEVSLDYSAAPLRIHDPGKTIQLDFEPGSYMTSGGRVFKLVQVHFHTPSEHAVDGERFPLVAHFVHATDGGELGVLGVMFEAGESNRELQKVVDALGMAGSEPSNVEGVTFNPGGLIPEDLEVYRYMGSLTTPPCTEGVHWHVAEQSVTAASQQVQALQERMGMNARPVLPLNNRLLVKPE